MYKAPSKDYSHIVGIKLYSDWGLIHHKELQNILIPTGRCHEGINWNLVETIYRLNYRDEFNPKSDMDYYHIVFGMISQFNIKDILYFINVNINNRPMKLKVRTQVIESRFGLMRWVPSEYTINLIERN